MPWRLMKVPGARVLDVNRSVQMNLESLLCESILGNPGCTFPLWVTSQKTTERGNRTSRCTEILLHLKLFLISCHLPSLNEVISQHIP